MLTVDSLMWANKVLRKINCISREDTLHFFCGIISFSFWWDKGKGIVNFKFQ